MLEKPENFSSFAKNNASLPDHAKDSDNRGIALDRVGIRGLQHPIKVMDRTHKMQSTVATIDAYVGLESSVRGTHMSRFVEILNAERSEITLRSLPDLLRSIQRKLEANHAYLSVEFPYFLERKAPVSGAKSLMNYPCAFDARLEGQQFSFELVVTVPVTSLCPCSKAVSQYGAHNQRSNVVVQVQGSEFVWIEDIIDAVEKNASAPLFALLKRADEKYVTELAYDNPKFVEDLVRDTMLSVQQIPGVFHVKVSAENFESIHNHSAYGETTWSPPASSTVHLAPAQNTTLKNEQDFGGWLRQLRQERKINQQTLGKALGTSASYISRVESGEKKFSLAALERLAQTLGMDPVIIKLRAGVLEDRVLQMIRQEPESFLAWYSRQLT
jgi:GTP cyclohydrolase I